MVFGWEFYPPPPGIRNQANFFSWDFGFAPSPKLYGQATLWLKMVHRRAAEIMENAQSNLWRDVEESKKSSEFNNPLGMDILLATSRYRFKTTH